MQRRRWWLLLGVAALGLAGVAWRAHRTSGPEIGIGPHKTAITWLPYGEAHRKPLIDLPWFGGGRFQWPRPSEIQTPPGDRADITAGYLLVDKSAKADDIVMFDGQHRSMLPWTAPGLPVWVMPVPFAPGRDRMKTVLEIQHGYKLLDPKQLEKVDITLPYDPDTLPARWPPIIIKAGPCKFEGYGYDLIEADRVQVSGAFILPQCTDWIWDEDVRGSVGSYIGGAVNREIGFHQGAVLVNGDLLFVGEVRFWTGSATEYDPEKYEAGRKKAKSYRYRVVFHPRPLK